MSINGVCATKATAEQLNDISKKIHYALARQLADQYGFQNPKIILAKDNKN